MSDTEWKHRAPQEYHAATGKLIHFTSKTVNSNAALVGIRLGNSAALDAPYVSLRTLLGEGVAFPLDYAEGGAACAGIVKQINAIIANGADAQAATEEERNAVAEGVTMAQASPYSVGTEHVDHRLRQILVPKDDAHGAYVSLTPITAGGLCAHFFTKETGLVSQHNEQVSADKDGTRRKVRQAQFGIGGSNPQNIGSLVRSMQRPLFVAAPRGVGSAKEAFALYHNGVTLDVHKRGELQNTVLAYVRFREALVKASTPITLHERQQEEQLIVRIASAILDIAAAALNVLQEHADILPKEELVSTSAQESYALVTPKVRNLALRALVDPELRPMMDNWPRAMAQHAVRCILEADIREIRLLSLDTAGRASLEAIMERAFR